MAAQDQQRTALKAALLLDLRALLKTLNPLSGLDNFVKALTALLTEYGQASAELGAQRYLAERRAAGVRSAFTPPMADPVDEKAIEKSVRWAVYAPTEGGGTPSTAEIENRIEGAAVRHMREPERETIAQAVTADPKARLWARVPEGPTTCYFCAMLCTRGAVYDNEYTAGRKANKKFTGHGQFKFHDHCDCEIVPVFKGQDYVPPKHVQEWDRIYMQSTSGVFGKQKVKAFRKAFDKHQKATLS